MHSGVAPPKNIIHDCAHYIQTTEQVRGLGPDQEADQPTVSA